MMQLPEEAVGSIQISNLTVLSSDRPVVVDNPDLLRNLQRDIEQIDSGGGDIHDVHHFHANSEHVDVGTGETLASTTEICFDAICTIEITETREVPLDSGTAIVTGTRTEDVPCVVCFEVSVPNTGLIAFDHGDHDFSNYRGEEAITSSQTLDYLLSNYAFS